MPAASTSAWEQPVPLPQQPDTPPMGVAQGSTPQLDAAPGHDSSAEPRRRPRAPTPWAPWPGTRPSARRPARPTARPRRPTPVHPACGRRPAGAPGAGDRQHAPPRAQRASRRRRRSRRPRRRHRHRPRHDVHQRVEHAGLRPFVGQLAGAVGLRVVGQLRLLGQPLRQRLPVRWRLRRLREQRQLRQLGSGNSGSSNGSGPSDVNAIASKIDPVWSTSTRRSATSRSRRPGRASCSRPMASS